ncbi:hypothetical protein ACN2C7_12455 [Caulobacter sp. ErkDOM-E]|uniref:hypothetical protein n=1 Tax=Caulobacter sp. ErkDOM-E TaxID=3402778 RepID=UPI003AF5E662
MPAFSQTLNLDSIDTVDTRRQRTPIQSAPVSAATDASPMFPAAPIYARKPAKNAANNMALLVGAPVMLVAAGAIAWAMMANPAQPPTETQQTAQMAIADTVPLSPPLAPATMPTPTPIETAVAEPAPRAVASAPIRATPRAAVVRRAAPAVATTPDASLASSNVSATVPAPTPAVIAEPDPVVIAAPVAAAPAPTPAPAPAPAPVTPVDPQ